MQTIALNANPRQETGKSPCRRLRRDGRIPMVLYGQGLEPVLLSIDNREFHRAVDKLGDEMVIFRIQADASGVQNQIAVIREVQRHPVTEKIVHIDMMAIDMQKPIEVEIAVHATGVPEGIREGGVLEQVLRMIRLRCLPDLVPSQITVEIGRLGLNQGVHVSDLQLAEGVEILSPPQEVIFHVIPPRKMEEAASAAEEGAEGAQPEVIGKKESKEGEESKTSG